MAVRRLYTDPSDVSGVLADQLSAANGITARAGGGQALATSLIATFNRVTTVATAADSAKLPLAKAGTVVYVFNLAAVNSLNVFPQTGEAINALGANAAYALAVTKGAMFVCMVNGTWNTILTA